MNNVQATAKKSSIWETLIILMCADSTTDTKNPKKQSNAVNSSQHCQKQSKT